MKKITLWLQLLKDIKVTGAVAFSSNGLVRQMIKNINFENQNVIVELGAGSGCITDMLANKISENSTLLVFEINPIFCKMLKEKFGNKNIHIINDSAEHIEKYLLQITGKSTADFVISSLPFTIMDNSDRNNIINSIQNSLTKKSFYVQYGYNKKRYNEILNPFKMVKTSFVMGNLPPAYIFNCTL
jgi:phospholipid N-methyltransferase